MTFLRLGSKSPEDLRDISQNLELITQDQNVTAKNPNQTLVPCKKQKEVFMT